MGNSQSSATAQPERRPNRLSKPPTNRTPILSKVSPNSKYGDLSDSTPYSYQSPWLSSAPAGLATVEERPVEPNESSGLAINLSPSDECLEEGDLNGIQGEELSSASTVKLSGPKRRFSVQDGAIGKRLSLNMDNSVEDASAPVNPRRATLQDMAQLMPAPQTNLGDTVGNSETKRYSAFRRQSLRTPGIATRVDDKPCHPNPSSENSNNDHDVNGCEEQKSSNEVLPAQVDVPIRNRNKELSPIRATSPNDVDYSYLGGLRPGSLHVVNGCASPVPSILRPAYLPETNLHHASCAALGKLSLEEAGQHRDLQETPSPVQNPPSSPIPIDGKSWLNLEIDDALPSPTFLPPIEVPHLMVTSKHTAAEDDLFEDEAVDMSTSPEPTPAAEDTASCTSKRLKNRTSKSKLPQEQDHSGRTQDKLWHNLYKSDSGYSSTSTSSKVSSQPPPGDLPSKRQRKTYDPLYAQCTVSNGDAFQDYRNNQEAEVLVSSTVYDKRSGEFTDGFRSEPALTRSDERPRPTLVKAPESDPELDVTPDRPYSNTSPSRPKNLFESSSQAEPWVTYRPDWWPLKGELNIPDKPDSGPPRVYHAPSDADGIRRPKKIQKRRDESTRTNTGRRAGGPLSSHAVSRTAVAEVSQPPPPLSDVQPESSRLSLPVTPRRHNSTGTVTKSDEKTAPEKYMSRIKSLVSLRGRQQQQQQQQRDHRHTVDFFSRMQKDEEGCQSREQLGFEQRTVKPDIQRRRLSKLNKAMA